MTAAHTPGPWTLDKHALSIWAPNVKGGDTKVFDVRGWGYLTGGGHGALGLSVDEAKAIQKANGLLAAAAPDMLAALKVLVNDSMYKDHPVASQMAIDAIAKATEQ